RVAASAERPHEGAHERLAPAAGAALLGEQLADVAGLDPHLAQVRHRQIVRQRPREHDAVDSACRRARADVDDDAALEAPADRLEQIEVDRLGIELGIVRRHDVLEPCARARRSVADAVQRARGAYELQDLLADPVDVDRERGSAEADQRDAQLLLAYPASALHRAPARDLTRVLHQTAPVYSALRSFRGRPAALRRGVSAGRAGRAIPRDR